MLHLFESEVFDLVSFAIEIRVSVKCFVRYLLLGSCISFCWQKVLNTSHGCFIYFLMREFIIMNWLWTFKVDREVVATTKIIMDLLFIVCRITYGYVYNWVGTCVLKLIMVFAFQKKNVRLWGGSLILVHRFRAEYLNFQFCFSFVRSILSLFLSN